MATDAAEAGGSALGESLVSAAATRIGGPVRYAIGGAALVTAAYGGWKLYVHQKKEYRLQNRVGFDPANDDIDIAIEVCDLCDDENEISRNF